MRYLNWDVLLFPGSSRVPLQEFDTKCHTLPDPNDHFMDNATPISNPYFEENESMLQIPILTSFVCSLEHGTPLRVSIHSWELPKPSRTLCIFKTEDERTAFEARVYIDGLMIAHRVFDERAAWPEVIDSVGNSGYSNAKQIRFPTFHSEILNQAHWDPGEAYGRIRVVIAEGVIGKFVDVTGTSKFDRLRDVIVFSFQHAPKDILEHTGIAWPNTRMFRQGGRGNTAHRAPAVPGFEAHAHSPQRPKGQDFSTKFLEPGALVHLTDTDQSKTISIMDDPFIGPMPISHRGKRSEIRDCNSNNNFLKDYNSVRTTRSQAMTEMSGVSYTKPDFEKAINQAAIDEIIRALSPARRQDLLEALSPVRKANLKDSQETVHGRMGIGMASVECGRRGYASSPHTAMLNSDEQLQASAYRSNLLASRFSSVPLLTPTTIHQEQRFPQAFRNSLDPLLSTAWNQNISCLSESSLGQAKLAMEMRPRSSSNVSKRKRQDSPGTSITAEHYNIPSMSTSPCKRGTATPVQSDNHSPGDGGVSLTKQE